MVDRICHIYEGGTDNIIASRSIDYSGTKGLSIRTATAYNHAVSGNAQDSFNLIKPLCDKLKTTWFLDAISATNCYAPQGNWAPAHIIKVDGLTTIDEYDAWCAENKPQISWLLATPITYTLTPQEITSLLGENNLWADTGDCEVEYRADTTLYISRLTEPDADMIADANIVSGQYFMVGNSLYRATSNIASGASVIVGTNAVKVSLATALNEINQ